MKHLIIKGLLIVVLFSCNSIYNNKKVEGITQVKIKTYKNYYEQLPISEALINSPVVIRKIEKMLKWLPAVGSEFKDFHEFNESKIIVEIHTKESSFEIRIINDRLEVQPNMYYNRLLRRERIFVSFIGDI